MRRFGLRSESGLGAMIRKEANCHMLCKQDPFRSSNKLHKRKEKASGGGLDTWEVLVVHLGKQDRYLHRSCGIKILALQERGQTMTHTMGAAGSRI